jgi:triosephosphate isomerase
MNGTMQSVSLVTEIEHRLQDSDDHTCDVVVCPPATLLHAANLAKKNHVRVGGQNCHAAPSGAHTGDMSAEMLSDVGAAYVIVGHSERRTDHTETDSDVCNKASAAIRANLIPIICVGETQEERQNGRALDVVARQIAQSVPDAAVDAQTIVAYEPVWAIGTGLVASIEDIDEVHNAIRADLTKRFGESGAKIQILYGGSMKPDNAAEILKIDNVNGGLVGGASLKADDFVTIIKAA